MIASRNIRNQISPSEQFECGRRAGLLEAAELVEKVEFESVRELLPAVGTAPAVIAATRGIVRATAIYAANKIRYLSRKA